MGPETERFLNYHKEEITSMYESGVNIKTIAEKVGITQKYITAYLSELGLRPAQKRTTNYGKVAQELAEQGFEVNEILARAKMPRYIAVSAVALVKNEEKRKAEEEKEKKLNRVCNVRKIYRYQENGKKYLDVSSIYGIEIAGR